MSALMHAVAHGKEDMVKLLLEREAEVDPQDRKGMTPLLDAVTRGEERLAEALLRAGAEADQRDGTGNTALMVAVLNNHLGVLRCLLKHGADMKLCATDGITLLQLAERMGHAECAQALRTTVPMEVATAADRGDDQTVQTWLEIAGGQVNATYEDGDVSGMTLLMTAASSGSLLLVDMLLRRGAKVDARTSNGWTALMHAALSGHERVVHRLLLAGSKDGETAIQLAKESGHAAANAKRDASPWSRVTRVLELHLAVDYEAANAKRDAEAKARGEALLAEIEAEEAEARNKESKKAKKKKKKGKGGGSSSAVPSDEPEASVGEAEGEAWKAEEAGAQEAEEVGAQEAGAGEAEELAAALEESARLEVEVRRAHAGDEPRPPPAAVSLADAVFDTGRREEAPESTMGGETTCIVCFTNPKTHVAVPCSHRCACGPCSAKMTLCPYCREPVMMWMVPREV